MSKQANPENQQTGKPTNIFPPEKRSFDTPEAAIYLRESESLLRKKRMRGTLTGHPPNPKFIRTGKRSIRYLREDLDAYLNQFRKLDHTHEDGSTVINNKDEGGRS